MQHSSCTPPVSVSTNLAFDSTFRKPKRASTVIGFNGANDLQPELQPARPGDIKDSHADISLAKKVLGYAPKVSLEYGPHEIVDC
jgi:nucleoside-diphosphate-sugar epimerase